MSETENYHLILTESDQTKFQEWRNALNGNSNSNMQIIDAVLGGKADSSIFISGSLLAGLWAGSVAPFTQEIQIEGLTSEQNGYISIAHNATITERQAAREAMLSVSGQGDGKLTIIADGELPEIDIPVYIILLG